MADNNYNNTNMLTHEQLVHCIDNTFQHRLSGNAFGNSSRSSPTSGRWASVTLEPAHPTSGRWVASVL